MKRKVCRNSGQRLPKERSESELSGNTSGVDSGVASMKDTCSPASESCASTTEMKGRRKKMPMKTVWNTNANTLKKTVNLNEINHFGRAVLRFCSLHIHDQHDTCYKNPAFSQTDIDYRKQYRAPAGALTKFLVLVLLGG